MTKSVLLSEDDHLRVTGGDTLTEGATYLLPVVFQRVDLGGERCPLLTPAGDFDGATFYRRVTLTGPESDKLTLIDHAEAWSREQGIGDGKQELLQACKALLAAWLGPSSGPADVDKAAELARAAIAKAEG
jgi:hypothetical protein